MSDDDFAYAVMLQNGGVAERLKAAVLKTADGKPSESSNLSSSATFYRTGQHNVLACSVSAIRLPHFRNSPV
ncbi:hypothetical protein PANT111_200028 [Pantoea brenneri]|jgi:hypothetical protein|uniref:Uncharacterized protein n=1 Tax=Pantoea brenneri TaxID=472694 RepID=A0AAX3J6Y2_9GAMM|nr:hypothetical protein PANT111_200028 [Pantoea brenneri]